MNFDQTAQQFIRALGKFLDQSRKKEKPVINQAPIPQIREGLNLDQYFRNGGLEGHALDRFLTQYLDHATRLHHPGYLAHQVGCPHPLSALGSLVDGITNNAMAIYEMGPAAAAIEFFMVNRLLDRVGWEKMPERANDRLSYDHGAGVLVHGGSLANLTSLMAARNLLAPEAREMGCPNDLAILAPAGAHYSMSKAAGILGIGEKNLVHLATDKLGRVLPDAIPGIIADTRKTGRRIVALTANACATGTGLYDPVDAIADICRDLGVWFHVDGAHGGCALFSGKYRHLLAGIAKADSMILDAHKMLRCPTLCAAILMKNGRALDHAFVHDADYIFHDKVQPGFDFIGQTVECTKAGLGLKFFLAFAALGEAGMAAYIDQTIDTTREAWRYFNSQTDFQVPYEPESNILCFRYKHDDGMQSADKLQLSIRDRLIAQGKFYISATTLSGKQYLRIVIISPGTGIDDIRHLADAIRVAAG